MPEKETSLEPDNHSAEMRPVPASEPDSMFKLFYSYFKKLPPTARWVVTVLVFVVFIIGLIWNAIPITKQKELIDYVFSSPKAKPTDRPPELSAPKYGSIEEEIRYKGITTDLQAAKNYAMVEGSPENKEKAFGIYQNILARLSPEAINELDQYLLSKANSDARAGNIDDALRKYEALFEKARSKIKKHP